MDLTEVINLSKELAEEFEGQFTCLGENTEKYINVSVPVEKKVIRIDKNGEETKKTISCRSKCLNKARFMASSLSVPVNILTEGIRKIKQKIWNVLRTFRIGPSKCVLGTMWSHLLDVPRFLFTFFSELIRFIKSIKMQFNTHWNPSGTSKMELFHAKLSNQIDQIYVIKLSLRAKHCIYIFLSFYCE